jgi:hypothetical protein
MLAGFVAAAPAYAAGESLNAIIEQTDGTAPFDALDADAANGLVRTNDTVGYTISVRSEGGAQSTPTIVFTLPKGQQLLSLPTYCLTGSSVVPLTLPDLPLPLTNTSWEGYPTQTVTCVLEDRPENPTTIDYQFTGQIMAEVPDGTEMDPMAATASSTAASDGSAVTDTSNEVQVGVVAEAAYDLSKNGTSSADDNTGHVVIQTTSCITPAFVDAGYTGCQTMLFPILISVQSEGKGNTPLSSNITFVDDISPDTIWGAGTTSKPGWVPTLAPAALGCGAVTDLGNGASFYPYGAIPGHTVTSSVIKSGTVSCAPGSTGPVTITVAGADTTATTYPTTNGTANVAMPGDKAYIVSGWIKLEYPTAALEAVGQANPSSPGSFQLPYENTFSDFAATDINEVPVVEANTENNQRRGTATVELGGSFGKVFEGEPGNPANSGGAGYAAGSMAGPPGSSSLRDGEGVVQAGGKALSGILTSFVSPPGFGGVTQVMCDAWDNTKAALTAAQWQGVQSGTSSAPAAAGTVGYLQKFPSNGASVWLTGFTGSTAPLYTVEYSNGTGGAASVNSCVGEDSGWFASPDLVPGNDAAQAANGIYTGVSRVRIIAQQTKADVAVDLHADADFSIGLTVLDSVVTGDVIGNWASVKSFLGDTATAPTAEQTIASAGTYLRPSTYNPTNHTGVLGDRINVQALTARIIKQVWDPSSSSYVSIGVPVYGAGVDVRYRLQPSLSAGVSTGVTAATIVEDCLPAHETFVSSSREGGDPIIPELVTTEANPPGASLSCASGETYIRWNLGQLTVNSVIPAVLYTVEVSAAAPNGILTNTARITAEGDASPAAVRTDLGQIQIQTPTGIKLAKTVVNPLIEVNPADATAPRPLDWNIQFAAVDTSGVSNVEIIDVLPAQGLNGTAFTGTLAFDSATAAASSGTATVLYTNEASASVSPDPDNAANGAAGATVWCDAPSGGAVVSGAGTAADCPTTASEVTGLRIKRAGSFTAGSTVDVAVRMIPLGNAEGDVYNNIAQADATGVIQGVGPVQRSITVVASEIGDFVWNDLNANGVQDAGEPGLDGVPVSLSGTDANGNTIAAATTTNAAGNYLFEGLPSGSYVVTFDPEWPAAHHFRFTLPGQGGDAFLDSDADSGSGQSGSIALGINELRPDVDAGVVQLYGGLVIVKGLSGAGATKATGPFDFSVECSYNDASVYTGTLSLERLDDSTSLTSERIGDIPVGASCVVTETGSGGADQTPAPVTVLIVETDGDNTVTAGFVNEFSAGTISLEKVLAGDDKDSDEVLAKTFTVQVICQVTVGDAQPVTVYSDAVHIKGGETLILSDAEGDPILLPLGTACFGTETENGGATKAVVDHDSVEKAATVAAGTPDALQPLLITATNTFEKRIVPVIPNAPVPPADPVVPAAPHAPQQLSSTGFAVGGTIAVVALLLAGGLVLLILRRKGRKA